jgi:hypothetical protein
MLLLTPFMSSIQVQWVMIYDVLTGPGSPTVPPMSADFGLMLMVKSLELLAAKSEPKPPPFTVMTPCVLLLIPFMSSIQVQWVMI